MESNRMCAGASCSQIGQFPDPFSFLSFFRWHGNTSVKLCKCCFRDSGPASVLDAVPDQNQCIIVVLHASPWFGTL
jgi:hypothetical protein